MVHLAAAALRARQCRSIHTIQDLFTQVFVLFSFNTFQIPSAPFCHMPSHRLDIPSPNPGLTFCEAPFPLVSAHLYSQLLGMKRSFGLSRHIQISPMLTT